MTAPARQTVLFEGVTRIERGKKVEETREYTPAFEKWWKLYPAHRRVKKREAFGCFMVALRYVSWEELMRKTLYLSESPKALGEYCPHPTTFLRNRRWEDDPVSWGMAKVTAKKTVDWNYKD